eukprot:Cvel_8506.t1-p1 / transcript=Cvel_8506.t1 / gene=Cvel_8506 / organism=Chromera_velia_CCMP2878 / gene_product=hypothetical protein / transcript_product=hypothetical protein / location=Cvel_scaffold471:1-1855(-) / protein_length=360 / sequence_SO=supercontig / SO=protein_coding / is_pseudo=false
MHISGTTAPASGDLEAQVMPSGEQCSSSAMPAPRKPTCSAMTIPSQDPSGACLKSSRTTCFRQVSERNSDKPEDVEALVQILKTWDSDQDGKFSYDDIAKAAISLRAARKETSTWKKLVVGLTVGYAVLIASILAVVVSGILLTRQFSISPDGAIMTRGKDAQEVTVKANQDSFSPFQLADASLHTLPSLSTVHFPHLPGPEGTSLEKTYSVQTITRNKDKGTARVLFDGGAYLDVQKGDDGEKFAMLFEKGAAEDCPDMYNDRDQTCPILVVRDEDAQEGDTGATPLLVHSMVTPMEGSVDPEGRNLRARWGINARQYGTGRGARGGGDFSVGSMASFGGLLSTARNRFYGRGGGGRGG